MDSKKVDNDTGEMIVKRVSVPIGLEELMEGLAKEVLLKKPEDLYLFAAKYFSHLLLLRDKTNYKVKTVRSAQSVIEPDQKWSGIPYIVRANQKQLTRQMSVRSETPSARKNVTSKPPQKEKQDVASRKQPDTLALEGQQKYMSSKRGYRRISIEKPKNLQMRDRSNSNEKTRPSASIAQPVQRPRRASLKKDEKPKDQKTKIPTAEAVKIPKQSEESAKSKSENDDPVSQKGPSSSEDPKSTTSSEVHSDKSTSDKLDSDAQSKSGEDHNVEKDGTTTEENQLKAASPSPRTTSIEDNKSESIQDKKKDETINTSHTDTTTGKSESAVQEVDSTDVDKRQVTRTEPVKFSSPTVKSAESKRDPSESNNGITVEPITKTESATLSTQASVQKTKSIPDEKKSSSDTSSESRESIKSSDEGLVHVKESGSVAGEGSDPSSSKEPMAKEGGNGFGHSDQTGVQKPKSTPNEENASKIASTGSNDEAKLVKSSDDENKDMKHEVASEIRTSDEIDIKKSTPTGSNDALTESRDKLEPAKFSDQGLIENRKSERLPGGKSVPSSAKQDVKTEAGTEIRTSEETTSQKSKPTSNEGNGSIDALIESRDKMETVKSSDLMENEKSQSLPEGKSDPSSAKGDMKNEAVTEIRPPDQTGVQKLNLPSSEKIGSNDVSIESKDKIEPAKTSNQGLMEVKKSELPPEGNKDLSTAREDVKNEAGIEIGPATPSDQKSKSTSVEEEKSNHSNNKTPSEPPNKTESPKSLDQEISENKNAERVSHGDKSTDDPKQKMKIEVSDSTKSSCQTGIETKMEESISDQSNSTNGLNEEISTKASDKIVSIKSLDQAVTENKGISKTEKDSIPSNEVNKSNESETTIQTHSGGTSELKQNSPESDKESKTIDNKNESIVGNKIKSQDSKEFEIKKSPVEADPINQTAHHSVASTPSNHKESLEKPESQVVPALNADLPNALQTDNKSEVELHLSEGTASDKHSKTSSIEGIEPDSKLNQSSGNKETPPLSAAEKRSNSTISSQDEKSSSTPKPTPDKKDSSTNLSEVPTRTSSQETKSNHSEVQNTGFKTTPTISISDHSNDHNDVDRVATNVEEEMETSDEVRKSIDPKPSSDKTSGESRKGSSSINDGSKHDASKDISDPTVSIENKKSAGINYSEDNTLADISDDEEINGSLSEKTRLKRESEHQQDSKLQTVVQDSVSDNKSSKEIKETLIFLEKEKSVGSETEKSDKSESCIHSDAQIKQQTTESKDINKTELAEMSPKISPTEVNEHVNSEIKEKIDNGVENRSEKIETIVTGNKSVSQSDTAKADVNMNNDGTSRKAEGISSTEENSAETPQVQTVENGIKDGINQFPQVYETKDQKGSKEEEPCKTVDGNSVAEDNKKEMAPIASQEEERNKDANASVKNVESDSENKHSKFTTEGTKDKAEVHTDSEKEIVDHNLNKISQNRDQLKDTTPHGSTDEIGELKVVPDRKANSTVNSNSINKADDLNNNKTDDQIKPSNTSIQSESMRKEDNAFDDINNNYSKTEILSPQKLSTQEAGKTDTSPEANKKGNTDELSEETTKSSEISEGDRIDDQIRTKRSIDDVTPLIQSSTEDKSGNEQQSERVSAEETKVDKPKPENVKQRNQGILDIASSEKQEDATTEGRDIEKSNQSDMISDERKESSRFDSDETAKSNKGPPESSASVNAEIAKEETKLLREDTTRKEESLSVESNERVSEDLINKSDNVDQEFKRGIDAEIAKKILEGNTHSEVGTEKINKSDIKEKPNQVDDDIIAKELLTALSQNDSAEEKNKTPHRDAELSSEKEKVEDPPSKEEIIEKSSQIGVSSGNQDIPRNLSNDTVDQESLDSTISALKTGVIDRAVRDYVNTFLSKEKVYNSAKLLDETKAAQHGEHVSNRSARTQSLEEQRNRVNSFLTKSKSVDGRDAITSRFDIERLREELGLSRSEPKSKHGLNKLLAVLKIQSLWRGFIVRKNLNVFAREVEREDKASEAGIEESHVAQPKSELLAAPCAAKESSSDSDRPTSIDSTDSAVTVISADKPPREKPSIHQDDLPLIEREHLLSDYQNQLLERISGKPTKADVPEDEIDEDSFRGTKTLERPGVLGTLHEEDNSDVEETANAPLLHTGELHDSIILPLSSNTENSIGNLKKDSVVPRLESPPKKLLHTGELHDSVLLPIESLGDVKGMEGVTQKREYDFLIL